MSEQHAPCCQAIVVDNKITHLAVHFSDGLLCNLRIIGSFCIAFASLFIPELKVGHIDINYSIQKFKVFHRIITGTIVDERDCETTFDGCWEGGHDLGDDMAGGDEVDIMATSGLQFNHK